MTMPHHHSLHDQLLRRPRAVGVRGLLWGLLLALACGFGVNQTAARPLTYQAGLVVQFDNDQVQTYCVNFDSETISGLQLLQSISSLQVIYDATSTGMGAGVCKINQKGCTFPIEDCFCQCQGLTCTYWSYWHLKPDNTWDYSQLGASSFILANGAVDGWRWGDGTVSSAQPPPVFTLNEICQPAPTATPTPTPLPTSTPTATPSPTVTPAPTATATATVAPTATPVVQISFSAAPTSLTPGQCSLVSWKVAGPWTAVYYNNAIVTPEEQRQVCPAQPQTLTLRVDTDAGSLTRSITLQVTGAGATVTPTPILPPGQTPTASQTPPPAPPTPTMTTTPAPAAPSPTTTATPILPTAAPALSATPAPPPPLVTATVTPTSISGKPGATPSAAAPAAVSPPQGNGLLWQYGLFGLILLALGGAVVFVMGRRSAAEDEE